MKQLSSENPVEEKPAEVLQHFIVVFVERGWLKQSIQIKYSDRRYRVFCDEKGFIAYRINDHGGTSPGAPGWPVCIIDEKQIIENSQMSQLCPLEPSAREWLSCLANHSVELL